MSKSHQTSHFNRRNNILPKKAQFYGRREFPDYDFYSNDAVNDAKKLADIYHDNGFVNVLAKSGVHYGTYKVFVVNSDGKSAMFPQGFLVSVAPTWSTSAGALTGAIGGTSYSVTVAASSDSTIAYSVTSGALPSGITLNSSSGVISGTAPSDASSTTYNFTIRATDAESQTADRAFSIFNLAVTKALVFTGGSMPSGITHSRTESVASRAHYINSSGYVTPVSSAGDARFTHRWNGSSAVAQGILIEERRGNYH